MVAAENEHAAGGSQERAHDRSGRPHLLRCSTQGGKLRKVTCYFLKLNLLLLLLLIKVLLGLAAFRTLVYANLLLLLIENICRVSDDWEQGSLDFSEAGI